MYKYLKGGSKARLFSVVLSDSTRGNRCKLKQVRFHLNIRKHFFYKEDDWILAQRGGSVHYWSCLKVILTLSWVALLEQGGQVISRGSFQLWPFSDSGIFQYTEPHTFIKTMGNGVALLRKKKWCCSVTSLESLKNAACLTLNMNIIFKLQICFSIASWKLILFDKNSHSMCECRKKKRYMDTTNTDK